MGKQIFIGSNKAHFTEKKIILVKLELGVPNTFTPEKNMGMGLILILIPETH